MFKTKIMNIKDVDEAYEIEKSSFITPWSKKEFENEITQNKMAIYVVALIGDEIVGYGGMWHVITEGHITNVAIKENYRKMGVGDLIVKHLIKIATEKEMIGLTLEVRVGNESAKKLYYKNGFVEEGIRKNYYEDTNEDAIIMWKYI